MSSDPRAVAVLAAARRHRAEAETAERAKLEDAITWAALHVAEEDDAYAAWGDTPVAITGPGAPLILEFCVAEFAAALGLRTISGRQYLADAVELAHRLPDLLAQVRSGRVTVLKARRIAQRTVDLNADGAAYVDRHVAFAASRLSLPQVERFVDEARARYQPEEAAELARQASDGRQVLVDTRQVSFTGTSQIRAEIDLADALDLEDALTRLAGTIAEKHPDLTRGACRARALGALARGEAGAVPEGRAVDLVVHLRTTEDGATLDPTAYVENGKHLVVLDQVRDWVGRSARIVVRPVIDLHDDLSVGGYAIPNRIAERVILRDRTCVFPFCERNARACDLDHIEPYDPHGPPDQTSTANLAPLCRHHHRLKTHGGWRYEAIEAGTYHWRSPYGLTYLTGGGTLQAA